MEINEALKRFRKQANISQADVCMVLKIKQPQYSRYETGERTIPCKQIIELCKYYHVSADYLLGLSDEP